MTERTGRLVLWLLALAVSSLLCLKDRSVADSGGQAAFLPDARAGRGGVTFRVEGKCLKSGVYQYKNAVSLGTVINMTVPFLRENVLDPAVLENKIYSGDVVIVSLVDGQHIEIKRDGMSVVEKMILGVPLDPNRLTVLEWEMLPRIGPSLAKRIVLDRQYNGDYSSVEALERVHGIGAATVEHLEGYFSYALVH